MSANNRDPFALARQGEDDAELFALIEEYWRLRRAQAEAAAEAKRRIATLPTVAHSGLRDPKAAAERDALREAAGVHALNARDDELGEKAGDIFDKIEGYRPKTPRGVLAIFDFGERDSWSDCGIWPTEAIAGLRAILEREGVA